MSVATSALLSQTIDAYIGWLAAWHRCAFLRGQGDGVAVLPEPPAAFLAWRQSAADEIQEQPAVEKLTSLYEQLHRLARLVILNAPEGQPLAAKDYESVIGKYEELVSGLRRLERAFAIAASGLDTLTGLRTRTGGMEDITREQNRFLRSGRPFCLVLMDIDHFKKINDTYGHDGGDKVLAMVASHVSRHLRSFDDAYRWGGEEFLLCLKETDAKIGMVVLKRLCANLAAKPVILPDGTAVTVTASFGFTSSTMDRSPQEMIRAADEALYKAKHAGRNRVECADGLPPG